MWNDVHLEIFFHFICYHKPSRSIAFSFHLKRSVTLKKLRKSVWGRGSARIWLGELTTLPQTLLGWGVAYPLPNPHLYRRLRQWTPIRILFCVRPCRVGSLLRSNLGFVDMRSNQCHSSSNYGNHWNFIVHCICYMQYSESAHSQLFCEWFLPSNFISYSVIWKCHFLGIKWTFLNWYQTIMTLSWF